MISDGERVTYFNSSAVAKDIKVCVLIAVKELAVNLFVELN
jgi:hypothetical protein